MVAKFSCLFLLVVHQACTALALPLDVVEPAFTTISPKNESQLESVHDAYNLDDVLSSIAAEFVFIVAGDHVLMPVPDSVEDTQLHRKAVALARLIQELYFSEKIYNLLNQTASKVAEETLRTKVEHNLLSIVLKKVEERLKEDTEMFAAYTNELEKTASLKVEPPKTHGQNISAHKGTVYEITPEQIDKGEELLRNPKVKALILCVSVLQQSQQALETIPPNAQWLREYTILARAVHKMAEKLELRERVQKAFDEVVEEYVEQMDVIWGDDRVFYEKLGKKIEGDEQLKSALETFKSSLHQ